MLNVRFYTFPVGHVVSDKEYARLQQAFLKVDVLLTRDGEADITLVKGFSHTWAQLPHDKPLVYYSIGSEYKQGIDLVAANEPIREIYAKADKVIHISQYCKEIEAQVFGPRDSTVIIPWEKPQHEKPHYSNPVLTCATTAIWRPVKRLEELKRVMGLVDVPHQLIVAGEHGLTTDFSYYQGVDMYIHLSRKEGMPNTVLEALAYGIPCLVTNHGGAKEAVGRDGYVIENDPEGLWDPEHIEPLDDQKFLAGFYEMYNNLAEYRRRTEADVFTFKNDTAMALAFKQVFESL